MKSLIPALITKLKADTTVTVKVSDRIYALWNPNDPNLLTTLNKFPFIGITAGVVDRVHEGSQLITELLRPKIWIYHELYKKETELFTELLDLQKIVMDSLKYETELTGYAGEQLIEALCIQLGEPEPFTNPDHPMAARISLTMEYQRVTEEVLV